MALRGAESGVQAFYGWSAIYRVAMGAETRRDGL